jgi:hypothetical protein
MGNRTALFNRVQPGGVFTISDLVAHPGDIWFVDSGVGVDAAGYGQNPDSPCATLDYAVGLCTANNGDVIYVMPGHAETIVADSGVDIDVAGVKVVGLGWGASRPTFTFTTAVTADFKLAAASVHVENILFLGGIDATTGVVEISGADCKLINCEYRDVTGEATDIIVTVNNADRLLIDGLRVIGAAGDGGDTAIALDGCDDAVIRNFDIYGNFDQGAIECRTTASNRIKVYSGTIWTEGAEDLAIKDLITASTGTIGPDLNLILQDNAANITEAITGATFQLVGPIWVVNAVAEQSMQINWTASTD